MSAIMVETILREVQAEVRFNLSSDSRTFDCKFIEAGLISYRDHEKGGIELLRRETIQKAMPTCIGNPLTIRHVLVTSTNRMEEEHGIITDWYFNPADGWFYVKGYADTPAAQVKIKAGKKPSCGYIVNSFGPGGKHHDIRYDKELTGITFNHLAIVDKPRFEDAEFRLNSVHVSQTKNMNQLIKLYKAVVARLNGADGKVTESTTVESHEVAGSTEIEIDGVRRPLHEVVAGFRKNSAAPAPVAAESLQLAESDEVEVEGHGKVKIVDLIAGFRKNSAALVAAPVVAAVPEGETPEQKATREAALRVNAAAADRPFITLHNARANAAAVPSTSQSKHSGSIADRCLQGQQKYGSVVVVTGKN